MAEIVRMPKLSDTMTEGVVSKWHKKVGDAVKNGELLADIETDKATMEFESFQEGVLLHIGVEQGKAAKVDAILAILGKKGEDIAAILQKEATSTPSVESKKEELTQLKVAAVVEKKEVVTPQVSTLKTNSNPIVLSTNTSLKISPLAKKLAQEKNIPLAQIKGSGDDGRIIKRDVENYSSSIGSSMGLQKESYLEVEVSQMRKTIARRLGESKFSAPHFYLTIDVDVEALVGARALVNETSATKISLNDWLIRAVAISLPKHPAVNSSWLGDKIRFNKHVNIGVAMAIEDGLVVPVIKFADTKRLSSITQEVKDYAEKAKNKKLQPQDFTGNTFTISNLGMYGIEEFTAIINTPDACILAVGAVRQEPVVKNNQISIGQRMKLTLSCDHRAVDGASGAQFLQTLKRYLENPVLLLGEGMV